MSESALTMLLEQTAAQSPAPDVGIIDRSVAAGETRLRRRTATHLLGAAAAITVMIAGATWTVSSKMAGHEDVGPGQTSSASASDACRRDYTSRPLPAWATSGF